jgi:hypothetical protein
VAPRRAATSARGLAQAARPGQTADSNGRGIPILPGTTRIGRRPLLLTGQQPPERILVQDRNPQVRGLGELRAGVLARDKV